MGHKASYVGSDGQEWPSVTEVLKVIEPSKFDGWYDAKGVEHCLEVKRAAGEFGTAVHAGIDASLAGEPLPPLTERQATLVSRALRWKEESGLNILQAETFVVHEELKYRGTFDWVGEFKSLPGVLWVGDWKSSNRLDKVYALQLAAYAAAYNAERGLTFENGINHGGIVRLAKKEDDKKQIELASYDNLGELFDVFKAALKIHQFINEGKRAKRTKQSDGGGA